MKAKIILTMIFSFTLCISAIAQNTEEVKTDNTIIPQGTTTRISLQSPLSSKINEVGDPVIGIVYDDIRSADGSTLVPRGTEISGRVTQVQRAKKPQRQATMTIIFESLQMSYGKEKISTTVTAIDDYANDEKLRSKGEGKVGGGHSGERTARNAGIGGALGSLGGIIAVAAGGGLGGAAAAIGAGALGGVIVTKGNDIKLAPGTIIRIRFERDHTLPKTS